MSDTKSTDRIFLVSESSLFMLIQAASATTRVSGTVPTKMEPGFLDELVDLGVLTEVSSISKLNEDGSLEPLKPVVNPVKKDLN